MEILWLADIEELAGVEVFRYLVLMQRVSQSRGSCVNNKWAAPAGSSKKIELLATSIYIGVRLCSNCLKKLCITRNTFSKVNNDYFIS